MAGSYRSTRVLHRAPSRAAWKKGTRVVPPTESEHVSLWRTGPIKESRFSLVQEESPAGSSLYSSGVSYVRYIGDRDESFISRLARERDVSVPRVDRRYIPPPRHAAVTDDDGIPFMRLAFNCASSPPPLSLSLSLGEPHRMQLANCVNKRYV